VTHNDTKINNVLMDEITGKALCVSIWIPSCRACGLRLRDSIRFGAATAAEDEEDLAK
jgi:hypothetical protein